MIEHLEVKNFKSLDQVGLNNLGRINLLLGKNNTGKTALLEALFFLALPSNPGAIMARLYEVRGYQPDKGDAESWNAIFYNWDNAKDIYLKATDLLNEQKTSRLLHISALKGAGKATGSTAVLEAKQFTARIKGLSFRFESQDTSFERKVTSLIRKSGQKQGTEANLNGDQPATFLPARGIVDAQQEARRYSQLEIANRHHEVVDIVRGIEPRLDRLTVIATTAGSVLYGDIQTGRLIPVSLMGDGMLRSLSIALAMINSKGGLVLIDEVENGLHYSVLVELWRMIAQSAQSLNVQVFAATHSDECIRAVYEAVASLGYTDDLRLYRFDLYKNKTSVVDYSAQELSAAIDSQQEVR
ncbi:MAG: AAA family ATPase [Proteobacteria bacterium]|nr:AAA family ATPase [Pseudomonadota bacterium]